MESFSWLRFFKPYRRAVAKICAGEVLTSVYKRDINLGGMKEQSGPEKREQLKQAYLQELRARKKALDGQRGQQYLQQIERALAEMSLALEADDSDQWIARLNSQSLVEEAKPGMLPERQAHETNAPNTPPVAENPAQSTAPGMAKDPPPAPGNLAEEVRQHLEAALPLPEEEALGQPGTKTLGDQEQ